MPTEQEGKVGILLQQLQEECCKDGAWVENKGVLLTYHFRNVPADKREPIVSRARELITEAGFNIGNAHCALEVSYIKHDTCHFLFHVTIVVISLFLAFLHYVIHCRASPLYLGTKEGLASTY